jgi:uncharacterized membrane protein
VTAIAVVEPIVPSSPCATTLGRFGGLTWNARDVGVGGPGPNAWSPCNAWLDSAGMHLRVDRRNGVWTSAEVYTSETLGYGSFEFEIASPLDALDPSVVLGLFTYPGGALDGQHEIDIEFAKFGVATPGANNMNYAVYPATQLSTTQGHCGLRWDTPVTNSVHRFTWSAKQVQFQSFAQQAPALTAPPSRSWAFTSTGGFTVSSGRWPLRMNLWLYGGKAPTNAASVEVVIRRVAFVAAASVTLPGAPSCG